MKDNSHSKYIDYYGEFLATMKKLMVSWVESLVIPISLELRLLHVADCIVGDRDKPNVYNTVRGKCAGLDYINRTCGHETKWTNESYLKNMVNYVKKYHPGEYLQAALITRVHVVKIYKHIIFKKISKLLTPNAYGSVSVKNKCEAFGWEMINLWCILVVVMVHVYLKH